MPPANCEQEEVAINKPKSIEAALNWVRLLNKESLIDRFSKKSLALAFNGFKAVFRINKDYGRDVFLGFF